MLRDLLADASFSVREKGLERSPNGRALKINIGRRGTVPDGAGTCRYGC